MRHPCTQITLMNALISARGYPLVISVCFIRSAVCCAHKLRLPNHHASDTVFTVHSLVLIGWGIKVNLANCECQCRAFARFTFGHLSHHVSFELSLRHAGDDLYVEGLIQKRRYFSDWAMELRGFFLHQGTEMTYQIAVLLRGPVLLAWHDADARLLANGETAYIWNLSCSWLKCLRQIRFLF